MSCSLLFFFNIHVKLLSQVKVVEITLVKFHTDVSNNPNYNPK